MECNDCKLQINALLCDIPSKWREQIVNVVCEYIVNLGLDCSKITTCLSDEMTTLDFNCLADSQAEWDALSFNGKIQAIIDKICELVNEFALHTENSNSVTFSGQGTLPDPLIANVNRDTITGGGNNILTIGVNGVYVPPQTSFSGIDIEDTQSVNLTGDGVGLPLTADVIRDTVTNGGDNILTIGVNGVYVPPTAAPPTPIDYSASNGVREDPANNFKLGSALIENTVINQSNFSLSILNDVSIGIAAQVTVGDRPKLSVSRNSFPNNHSADFAGISVLEFIHSGEVGNNTLYTGTGGMFAFSPTVNRALLPSTHYSGVTGLITSSTDFNITDGILSGVSAISVFSSESVGLAATHGKLAKYAGFRVRAPLQDLYFTSREHGGIDDVYGLLIDQLKVGNLGANVTRSWGVYQVHSGDNNFLAGNVKIGGTDTLTPSAALEISSTTKGFLLPRMTKAERDVIASPVAGLAIYQTDNTPGLRVYNGTNWMRYTETID